MSNLSAEDWRVKVWDFFEPNTVIFGTRGDADLSDFDTSQCVDSIFDSVRNGDQHFIAAALPALETVSGRSYDARINTGQFPVMQQLLTDLQSLVNRRACELGLPALVRNVSQTRFQGRVLRQTSDGQQLNLPIQLSNETSFNDIQMSADGLVLVTAGAGQLKRNTFLDLKRTMRQECEDFDLTGGDVFKSNATTESFDGINIYVRSAGNKNAQNMDWTLVQSELVGITVTRLHINSNGSRIVAYAGRDNNLFIVERPPVSALTQTNDPGQWQFRQGLDLVANDNNDVYAVCHGLTASADQSLIAVSNRNLSTGVTAVWIIGNGTATCPATNQLYQPQNTSVCGTASKKSASTVGNEYDIVQTIVDQDVRYQRVRMSRDGSTLLLEFGEPITIDFTDTDPRINFLGLRVYHWQLDRFGVCQFELRQTIEYGGIGSEWNETTQQYDDSITGHTQELQFAGANDNRIVRIAVRGIMDRNELETYIYPTLDGTGYFSAQTNALLQQGNQRVVGDSEILQVFDRAIDVSQDIDICGAPIGSGKNGIVNTDGLSLSRGEFVEFVAKPYVELKGFDIFPVIPDGLYTHPVNPGIFMLSDKNNRSLHLYVESEQDNVWTKVPSTRFEPLKWQATSLGGRMQSFNGYMTVLQSGADCGSNGERVCMVFADEFVGGEFDFQVLRNGRGRYDGPGPTYSLSGVFLSPSSHFITQQFGTDAPFLAQFPTTRTTGDAPKDLISQTAIDFGFFSFTASNSILPSPPPEPLPGCEAIQDWPCVPFPLQFNVWQRWPQNQPPFAECGGFRLLTPLDPFVKIGCESEVELVLTPRFVDFNPANANKVAPNPNLDPSVIFSVVRVPVYTNVSVVCFDLPCSSRQCRADSSALQQYFNTGEPVEPFDIGARPSFLTLECSPGGGVRLFWGTTGTQPFNRVKVQRREGKSGPWNTEFDLGFVPTPYDDDTTLPDTLYSYRVAFCDANDNRTVSESACIRTAPPAPTNLQVTNVGISTVTLTWTNNTNAAVALTIGANGNNPVTVPDVNATSFTLTNLDPNTFYNFFVTVEGVGGKTANSESVQATTLPPLNLRITEQTQFSLTLEWDHFEGNNGYVIKRDGEQIGQVLPGVMRFVDATTQPDVEYCYQVCIIYAPDGSFIPSEKIVGGQLGTVAKFSSPTTTQWTLDGSEISARLMFGRADSATLRLSDLCGPSNVVFRYNVRLRRFNDALDVRLNNQLIKTVTDTNASSANPIVATDLCFVAVPSGSNVLDITLRGELLGLQGTISDFTLDTVDITTLFDPACAQVPNTCFTNSILPAKWFSQTTPAWQSTSSAFINAELSGENETATLVLDNIVGDADIQFDYSFTGGSNNSGLLEFVVNGNVELTVTSDVVAATFPPLMTFALTGAGPHRLEWRLTSTNNTDSILQMAQISRVLLRRFDVTPLFDANCGYISNAVA